MKHLFRLILLLLVLGGIGLVGYAYLGPFLGVDFSAPLGEIRVPVTLNAN